MVKDILVGVCYDDRVEERYAITGATGLLGSHLIKKLKNKGKTISVLIRDENAKSLLIDDINKFYGDISNRQDVDYFIQRTNPTHFIHLAAQTQAYESLKYPYSTFYNNVFGTLNILESLKDFNDCKAIIVASSDKAYGSLIYEKYTENHPLNGIYPYDASKSATDIISNSYRQTYNLPIVTTRACNIYGEGDYNTQRIIPGIIHAFIKRENFVIRNGGEDYREYIHVDDLAECYMQIIRFIEEDNSIPSFNITSRDGCTTLDLFRMIQNLIGSSISHEISYNSSLEIKKQVMDDSLLRNTLNWKSKKTLKDSLPSVVKWYLQNLSDS
jgi:CDP-glucose 4,6-dehydratase